MKLLIILNTGLKIDSFFGSKERLLRTASELDIDITLKFSGEISYFYDGNKIVLDLPKFDAVLFYAKDVNLANALEKNDYKVFNSSNTITLCDNKAKTYKILTENQIKIPKTFIIPLTFYYEKTSLDFFKKNIINELQFPMIAKKWYGSMGEQVYLINNENELDSIFEKEKGKELLFQKFYSECFGEDLRVNIVGNRIVSAVKRKSVSGDFRSNLSRGSVAKKIKLSNEEIEIALKSAKILNCDFCGVDILKTSEGPVICEVNSNAQMRLTSKFSKENILKDILNYIKNKI